MYLSTNQQNESFAYRAENYVIYDSFHK